MPGASEIVTVGLALLMGLGLILAGVSRLRKKLAADARPSVKTWVNELGGYVIVGVLILIGGSCCCLTKSRTGISRTCRP